MAGSDQRSKRCLAPMPRNRITMQLRNSQLRERRAVPARVKAAAKAKAKYMFIRPNERVLQFAGHHYVYQPPLHREENEDEGEDREDPDARGSEE